MGLEATAQERLPRGPSLALLQAGTVEYLRRVTVFEREEERLFVPRLRVYLDTSVFGGVCDEEFAEPSQRFFGQARRGRFVVLVSLQTLRELEQAPQSVRDVLTGLPAACLEALSSSPEVNVLAAAYVEAGVVGRASWDDALHVAAATVAEADLVLSWNFRHIVQYERIKGFNGVNAIRGYRTLDVRSPLEVVYGEGQDV